ncbi:M23 family metallopeptidase [Altererythrobacter sp. CAU 1778]
MVERSGFTHTALALSLALAACQAVPDSAPPQQGGADAALPLVAAQQVSETPPPPAPARPGALSLAGEFTQGGWMRGVAPANTRSITLDGQPLPIAEDGTFFAAFDRDAAADARFVLTSNDGASYVRDLRIAPRDWQIERVNVARRSGGPTEAFLRLRRPELERIAAAREIRSNSDGWRQDFVWPVRGRISGRFGSQRIYRGEPGSYHSGLDIATGGSGTAYVAPADGVVVLAASEPFSLEGNLLIIDHGNGLNSAFLHSSRIVVREGERVERGQYIGNIGATGRATGPHLHWSLKWNDARLDPLLFLDPM